MTILQADKVLESLVRSSLDGHDALVAFHPPTTAWSGDIPADKPTVNLYLYELSENAGLRRGGTERSPTEEDRVNESKPPVLVDLRYVASVWLGSGSHDHAREHAVLSKLALLAFRQRTVPSKHIPDDAWLPAGFELSVRAALSPAVASAGLGGFWRSMGQPWKPAIPITVTIPLETVVEHVYSVVASAAVRFQDREEQVVRIAGIVRSGGRDAEPIESAAISLFGPDSLELASARTGPDGRFALSARTDRELALEVRASGYRTTTQRIERLKDRSRDDLAIQMRRSGG